MVELPTNCLKDQLSMLQKMLNLLRANIIHVPLQHLEFLLPDIDIVIIDVGLLVYLLCEDKREHEDKALGEV